MRAPARAIWWSPWVAALLFLFSLPAVTTRFYASDEVEFYAWLRSAAFDRDVDFTNEYQYFHDAGAMRNAGFRDTFLTGSNEAGRRPNFTPIGTAILWSPFFVAGHVAARITGAPANGFSYPYIAAVTYGSAVYGFLAVLLTGAIVRKLVGPRPTATLAVWMGTPLLFYMYVAPGFGHAASAFAVSLFIWIWLEVRTTWSPGGVVALGTCGALMAMVREQDAFFVLGPAIDFLRRAGGPGASESEAGRADVVKTALLGAGTFILAYAPQLAAYQALNGHPGPTRLVARKMTWTSPHFFEVLLSVQHGLFFWTPLALVALIGLALFIARRVPGAAVPDMRWVGVVLAVMFALQVYVSGSVESWTVAGSFGQRRFVATTPILAVGLAALFASSQRTVVKTTTALVVALCVWWNLGLLAQFGLHTMDRQRLTLASNARATFIDLPTELPGLVWRYMTDRSSFYSQPQRPAHRELH